MAELKEEHLVQLAIEYTQQLVCTMRDSRKTNESNAQEGKYTWDREWLNVSSVPQKSLV